MFIKHTNLYIFMWQVIMVSREFGSENHTTYCWQMLYYKILSSVINYLKAFKNINQLLLLFYGVTRINYKNSHRDIYINNLQQTFALFHLILKFIFWILKSAKCTKMCLNFVDQLCITLPKFLLSQLRSLFSIIVFMSIEFGGGTCY